MKKSIQLLTSITLIAALTLNFNCGNKNSSDQIKEGVITYDVTYPDLSTQMQQMKKMLPTQMIVSIKGDKSRTEMKGGMAMSNSVTIFDSKANKATTLINMMGKKLAMEMDSSQIKEQLKNREEMKVEKKEGTKKIAGYECKKALISGNGQETTVYYTDKVNFSGQNLNNPYANVIKGLPLQYSMKQSRFTMEVTASDIAMEKVDDSLFNVPDDYQKVTQEELQQMMQQGMGGQ